LILNENFFSFKIKHLRSDPAPKWKVNKCKSYVHRRRQVKNQRVVKKYFLTYLVKARLRQL